MSRKDRQRNLKQMKERRQKQLAVGGAVLLAVVLAFELPSVLGGGGSSSPPAASTSAAGATSTTPATTSPGTAAAAATVPTSVTRLPNSDVTPRRSTSQLGSLSLFASKDPFVQQVTPATSSTPGSSSSSPSGGSKPASSGGGNGGGGSGTSNGSQTLARVLTQSGAVTIMVNGKSALVRVGATFPSSNPVFKLVSFANGVAQVGIANGSYSSGAQTVSLALGKSMTLVDTADGTRYVLQLVSGG